MKTKMCNEGVKGQTQMQEQIRQALREILAEPEFQDLIRNRSAPTP